MYLLICFLFEIGSLGWLIYESEYGNSNFIILPIILFFIYPLITENIYNLLASILDSESSYKSKHIFKHLDSNKGFKKYQPIVYNSNYNITACGIEKLHPFDSTKYLRIYN